MNWRNIVISVLSAIIALLGGSQYQQASSINDMQKNITELRQNLNIIAGRESD